VSRRRITIVASELLGRSGTGGAGTADSLLAVALGRHGYPVRLLIATGREIGTLNPEWLSRYESAGVEITVLEPTNGVRPAYLAPTLQVFNALRDDPPEVAIVNDWRGLGFAALRARQTGIALRDTAFVVHCHGPGRVLTEFAQKVPDTVERFAEDVIERASVELADALVSPSAWLLDWMRAHGWPVPQSATVIQYVRQSAALDEIPERAPAGGRIGRLAFFGQLREGKGIRIFVEALEMLPPDLLGGIDVLFLGSGRGRWAVDRIAEALPPALTKVRFETSLEREAALVELRAPGTLAVMPSLLDNSPNTVAECIEHGIPFVSTDTGGIPELVAEEDRSRVLCRPAARDLATALETALRSADGFAPARPARDAQESIDAWVELVEAVTPAGRRATRPATHVAVVVPSDQSAEHARRLAASTQRVEVEVVVAETRRAGFQRTAADWIVFLDDDDTPDDALLDAFVSAQAESDADVVTVAVRPADDPDAIQLFLGDPGPLGLLENHYGVLGLVRASALAGQPLREDAVDADWPLFARIALAGGRIVSLPQALSGHSGTPGRAGDVPGEGLAVLEAFEEHPIAELRGLPQFAATLAASLARPTIVPPDGLAPPLAQRLRRRVALLARARRPG
jgi:glycosyltransferase involved in cell wall biosynthesis